MGLGDINITASILILLLIIIRSLSLYSLPKRVFVYLWGIVIVRLLLPISISIPIPARFSTLLTVSTIKEKAVYEYSNINNTIANRTGEFIISGHNLFDVFNYIRVTGIVIFFAFFVVSLLNSYYRIRESIPAEELIFNSWIRRSNLGKIPQIRLCDRISSPITSGFFRSKIIIPTTINFSDAGTLDYVLTHEYIHIKRHDTIWKLILNIVVCIYWYNPFIWIMYILCNRDIEISCDEKVVTLFGRDKRADYAKVLITLAGKKSQSSPISLGFGTTGINERIGAIMNYKGRTFKGILIATLIMIGVSTVFLTANAAEKSNQTSIQSDDDWKLYFEELTEYGVEFDSLEQQIYFNGEPVKVYADNMLKKGSKEFKGILYNCKLGEICIRPIKKEDQITSIEVIPVEELNTGSAGFTVIGDNVTHDSGEYRK